MNNKVLFIIFSLLLSFAVQAQIGITNNAPNNNPTHLSSFNWNFSLRPMGLLAPQTKQLLAAVIDLFFMKHIFIIRVKV